MCIRDRVEQLPNGRYSLKKSATAAKDQTYALYNLTQEQLSHTLMPVGEYTKDQIRQIAEDIGLQVAHKADSQEICFIPDNDYAGFIEREAENEMCIRDRLKKIGKDFVNDYLYDIEKAGIHSYRYRTKKAGHLLEKIIRKKSEQPDQYKYINRKNYYKYMTDLIGIRVFFLYREDWIHFHNYITSVFENDPANYIEDRLLDFDDDPDHYYIAERPKVYRLSLIHI